jgi:DNA primase
MIGNPIAREAYIKDCSARLGFSEQTLTAKMNEEIRTYREEARKEEARELYRQEMEAHRQEYPSNRSNTSDQPDSPAKMPVATIKPATVTPLASKKKSETAADLLMKIIIQHGNKVIYDNLTDNEGNTISLTVAELISYSLSEDSLQFSEPLYNIILQEAVEHGREEDFNSESYFTLHPDYDISSHAIRLVSDSLTLSKSFEVKLSIEQLRDKIEHLLYEFRNDYIKEKLVRLRNDIKITQDTKKLQELIMELQETEKIRTAIAKKIGGSLKA